MKKSSLAFKVLAAAILAGVSSQFHAFAGTAIADGKSDKSTTALEDWRTDTISPVTNPIFFEDPMIRSEIRGIYAYHEISNDFLTKGGLVRLYALQVRWAVTDRLAIIATKDGYINFAPTSGLKKADGWANIGAGVKYAVIDDRANQFILTPGVKFEFASGSNHVFQGSKNGSGQWDVFVSAEKGFKGKFIDKLHLTGSLGFIIPNDFSKNNAEMTASVQADYFVHRFFIPFVAANSYTVLSNGSNLPLNTGGYDLLNFGSSNAAGWTGVVLGAGFRSRLLNNLDVGFAWEHCVTSPQGLFDNRLTVDAILRF